MKHAFILGTPFSGSTLVTNVLGAHPQIVAVGELERLPKFRRYEHLVANEPDIYDSGCFLCRAMGRVCPIWNASTLDAIAAHENVFETHRYLGEISAQNLGKSTQVVLDSSKTPDWLRYAARSLSGSHAGYRTTKNEDVRVVLTTKSVFGFAESMIRRSGVSPILAGQIWGDIMTDALRVIGSLGVPSMIVRYEAFARDRPMILRRVLRFLSVDDDDGTIDNLTSTNGSESHAIGGNAFAYKEALGDRLSSISVRNTWETLRAEYVRGEPVAERRWMDALSEDVVDLIASARGVQDLSYQIGYNLHFEMRLFRERQAARANSSLRDDLDVNP